MNTTSKKPTVKVVSVRMVSNRGNLRALASVQIGPLQIHDFRVIQQEGQRAYVSAPQLEWKDGQGRSQYKPLLSYPESWKDAISEAVLIAYQLDLDGELL